jgi:hypothetical protein
MFHVAVEKGLAQHDAAAAAITVAAAACIQGRVVDLASAVHTWAIALMLSKHL